MKDWNVRVFREGRPVMLGQVSERNEALARCAALHKFGVSDDELAMREWGREASPSVPTTTSRFPGQSIDARDVARVVDELMRRRLRSLCLAALAAHSN